MDNAMIIAFGSTLIALGGFVVSLFALRNSNKAINIQEQSLNNSLEISDIEKRKIRDSIMPNFEIDEPPGKTHTVPNRKHELEFICRISALKNDALDLKLEPKNGSRLIDGDHYKILKKGSYIDFIYDYIPIRHNKHLEILSLTFSDIDGNRYLQKCFANDTRDFYVDTPVFIT